MPRNLSDAAASPLASNVSAPVCPWNPCIVNGSSEDLIRLAIEKKLSVFRRPIGCALDCIWAATAGVEDQETTKTRRAFQPAEFDARGRTNIRFQGHRSSISTH